MVQFVSMAFLYLILCVAKNLSGSMHSLLDRFMNYGKDRVKPVIQYLKSKFSNELYQFLKQLKSLQGKVKEMTPDISMVNQWRI